MGGRQMIAEIINDFQASAHKSLTHREIEVPALPPDIRKALAFVGMRRAGKTFLMHQILQGLEADGVARRQLCYVNFEDERLDDFRAGDLGLLLDVQAEIYPEVMDRQRYLFLDEIQVVDGWEKFVRRALDMEDVRVFLSGSSAKMLAAEVASSLRGRGLSIEVSPFSFREYLAHGGDSWGRNPSGKDSARLRNRFNRYLNAGGFPEVAQLDDELRISILQEYVNVAILRDIVERHAVANSAALKFLVRFMLENGARLLSVNKAYNVFKSQGRAISKDSLYAFVDHIQDAFLAFTVELFSPSRNVRAANPKKVYAVDQGLLTAFSWRFSRNEGALLENAVYSELRRREFQISYYRTRSGKEVDFCCLDRQGRPFLYQVSTDISDEETALRERNALWEALDEVAIDDAVLVTLHEEGEQNREGRTIRTVPAWKWFLGLS